MRCLNEDDKEQYKGDKNIIVAKLISDTKPEDFPHDGGAVSNLTSDDLLSPGSTLQILDGSGDIYMMKEANFNPNAGEITGHYEIRIEKGGNALVYAKLFDVNGNLIDSCGPVEPNAQQKPPYKFHDIMIREWYDNGTPSVDTFAAFFVDVNSKNTLRCDGVDYKAGDKFKGDQYNNWYWYNGTFPINFSVDIVSGYDEEDWCKISRTNE